MLSASDRASLIRMAQQGMCPYRHLDIVVVAFVAVLLVSNLMAHKIAGIGPFKISGAELLFAIAYIFRKRFTEVFGYAASIWMGFFAMGVDRAAAA